MQAKLEEQSLDFNTRFEKLASEKSHKQIREELLKINSSFAEKHTGALFEIQSL